MRWSLVLGGMAAMAALASCSSPPSPPPLEREALEVREVVFRDLLKHEKTGAVCFIAFVDGNKLIDPAQGFLDRLGMPQLTLRPVSDAVFPKRYEMDPEDPNRYQGVRDPRTGKRCTVYSVQIESIASQAAKVTAETWGGPLSGGGYESNVVRENDRWVIKFDFGNWVY